MWKIKKQCKPERGRSCWLGFGLRASCNRQFVCIMTPFWSAWSLGTCVIMPDVKPYYKVTHDYCSQPGLTWLGEKEKKLSYIQPKYFPCRLNLILWTGSGFCELPLGCLFLNLEEFLSGLRSKALQRFSGKLHFLSEELSTLHLLVVTSEKLWTQQFKADCFCFVFLEMSLMSAVM